MKSDENTKKFDSAVTYSSYLKVEELLQLQSPRSAGPEHDEMLFIIVHQTYELWFKCVLHELARAQQCCAAVDARPNRKTIVTDTANFPTDRYILEGICKQRGMKLVLIDDDSGEEFVSPEMLAAVLNDDVALVTLSVIQYRSGVLHDIGKLTQLARASGALFVWDASHAVGVVPMQFERDKVDLAVGCTYKYCNSGPGSPAWLFVSKSMQAELQVPIQGWFAQRD
ncbi:MAG: aminotransferase class V-fold PLP-dependent enzyme, partial [Actinobacteria bacterium]|nr:aminotransferase class V-fold PLP-dependent enzyme [Actinomycetota bacterium]